MKLVFLYSTCALLQGCPNCTQESLFYRENRVKSSSSYTLQVFFGGVVSCSPRIYIFKISPFPSFDRPSSKSWPHTGQAVRCPCKKKMGEQQCTPDSFSIWCIWCHLMIQHDSDGLSVSPSPEKKNPLALLPQGASVTACARPQTWHHAIAVLQQVATLGLEANAYTCGAATSACGPLGKTVGDFLGRHLQGA